MTWVTYASVVIFVDNHNFDEFATKRRCGEPHYHENAHSHERGSGEKNRMEWPDRLASCQCFAVCWRFANLGQTPRPLFCAPAEAEHHEHAARTTMTDPSLHVTHLRVRYGETDQMHSYHHSRVLEWFGSARTEMLRSAGTSYREMESRGLLLPVTEVHVEYLGRAEYDDLLQLEVDVVMASRARVRFDVRIDHADSGAPVCCGRTIHAITNPGGKPMRPPAWFVELVESLRRDV